MTLPAFLDAAFALWMEEKLRIQPQGDFAALREIILPSDAQVERPVPKEAVKQQNEEAMAALKAMMAGVRKRK